MENIGADQVMEHRGSQGSIGTFVLPVLLLLAALGAFWFVAQPRSASVTSVATREAQVMEGAVQVTDGKQFSAGERFGLLSVQNKTLACADSSRLRRIDDVELRLRPCRFQFVESGIRVEGGGLQVWVYKPGTPFTTQTPSAVMGVLGTRFEVDVLPDQSTTVHVLEGKVEVKAVTGGAIKQLEAGSGLRITMAGQFEAAPLPQAPEQKPPEQQSPQGTQETPGPDGTSQPAPEQPQQGSQGNPDSSGTDEASATPVNPDVPQPGGSSGQDDSVPMDQLLDTR